MKEGGMVDLVFDALPMNWVGPVGFKGLMTHTHVNTVPGPGSDECELPRIAVHHCVPTFKIMAELIAIASLVLLIEVFLLKMAALGKRIYTKVKPDGAVEPERETGDNLFYRRKPLPVESSSVEQVPGVSSAKSLLVVGSEKPALGVSGETPAPDVSSEKPARGDSSEDLAPAVSSGTSAPGVRSEKPQRGGGTDNPRDGGTKEQAPDYDEKQGTELIVQEEQATSSTWKKGSLVDEEVQEGYPDDLLPADDETEEPFFDHNEIMTNNETSSTSPSNC